MSTSTSFYNYNHCDSILTSTGSLALSSSNHSPGSIVNGVNGVVGLGGGIGIGGGGGSNSLSNEIHKSVASSFVKKLFDMVENESDDIIVWVANGTAFEVKDPKRLETEILPNFFRHCRFQSLVRQLNFYAFKKISKERSSWVYSHDHFKKNRPDLLEKLRRKTNGVAVKRHAEELNNGGALRKKRRNSIQPQKYSSDDSSDEFFDEETYPDNFDNDRPLSQTCENSLQNNEWITNCHSNRTNNSNIYLDYQNDNSDEDTGNQTSGAICSCWNDVHHYFGLNNNNYSPNYHSYYRNIYNYSFVKTQHDKSPLCNSKNIDDNGSYPEQKSTTEDEEENNDNASINKLLTFCLYRNPFIQSNNLYSDILKLITTDNYLIQEINNYFIALLPHNSNNQNIPENHMENSKPSTDITNKFQILQTNEITIVRTFINYAIARMHEYYSYNSELNLIINKWINYARKCT